MIKKYNNNSCKIHFPHLFSWIVNNTRLKIGLWKIFDFTIQNLDLFLFFFIKFSSDSVEVGYHVILDNYQVGIIRWIGVLKNKQHFEIELFEPVGCHDGKNFIAFIFLQALLADCKFFNVELIIYPSSFSQI